MSKVYVRTSCSTTIIEADYIMQDTVTEDKPMLFAYKDDDKLCGVWLLSEVIDAHICAEREKP